MHPALLVLGLGAVFMWRRGSSPLALVAQASQAAQEAAGTAEQIEPEQAPAYDGGAMFDNLAEEIERMTAPTETDPDRAELNRAAFLMMIRTAEGTAGPDGYRTMFGGSLFTGWADHPRQVHRFGNLWTSAAGAYQFMAVSPIPGGGSTRVDTWDRVQRRLGLPDFSPASQDAAALYLVDEAGALLDVEAGRFAQAVGKVRRIWASMPGAGYGQPEQALARLESVYLANGGTLA